MGDLRRLIPAAVVVAAAVSAAVAARPLTRHTKRVYRDRQWRRFFTGHEVDMVEIDLRGGRIIREHERLHDGGDLL
ncbi:hypothetical protein [Allonocardiopsis opalescens]|uniref:Uncharacterized protein n=1 Tax=Allonocardiopsis opalescens TaxID=1144618 RepID=A0A2T0PP77_9ACTN|nr:hypothetical protein [Allonocardiopsis opalescens]PRX90687.1 hypothetical protein CLV72_11825 [Allonocardiopsis opalescens]